MDGIRQTHTPIQLSQTLATDMHRLVSFLLNSGDVVSSASFACILIGQSLQGAAFLLVGSASAFPMAFPDGPQGPLPIPRPGSDGSYAGDNYFQYINVPTSPLSIEWGYRRGNPDHNREEYLSQKDHTFKAKVRMTAE